MLVFSAGWIRAERGYANSVFDFHRLRVPRFWRTEEPGRHPALDMPAIVRNVLRHAPQFDRLAVRRFDEAAQAPYLIRESRTEPGFITYDDPESTARKLDYALGQRGVGGFFTWSIGGRFSDYDGQSEDLMTAMYQAFAKYRSAPEPDWGARLERRVRRHNARRAARPRQVGVRLRSRQVGQPRTGNLLPSRSQFRRLARPKSRMFSRMARVIW